MLNIDYSCNFRSNEMDVHLVFDCMEIFGLTKYNFTTEWKVQEKAYIIKKNIFFF